MSVGSTDSRAFTSGGSTSSRYSADCASNSSQPGIDTTRTAIPSSVSLRPASSVRPTSAPVAIRIRSGEELDSHSVYAPRSSSEAGASSVLSSVGTFCRENESATGPSVRSSATRQACAVSFASAGRTNQRNGMARSAAYVSTGWCVGPSSPRPTESCVQTQTTGSRISAERRTAGRM